MKLKVRKCPKCGEKAYAIRHKETGEFLSKLEHPSLDVPRIGIFETGHYLVFGRSIDAERAIHGRPYPMKNLFSPDELEVVKVRLEEAGDELQD